MRWSLALFLALAVVGCGSKEPPEKESNEEEAVIVSSMDVTPQDVTNSLHLVGEIKAIEHVALHSKVNGKLASYAVQKGKRVNKGDLVASIDRDEVGYTFNQAPVYSSLTGVVASLPLDEGSEVRMDQPIAYVMNMDQVKVVFDLPERYRNAVKVGQKVVVHTLDQVVVEANVSDIDPLIKRDSHTFTIEAKMDNEMGSLLPGMFATGELVLETFEKSVLLPEEAITAIQGEWFIYKVMDEHAVLQKIKTGMRKEGMVQIEEGVCPGDHVIVGGNHKVKDGQKVKSAAL